MLDQTTMGKNKKKSSGYHSRLAHYTEQDNKRSRIKLKFFYYTGLAQKNRPSRFQSVITVQVLTCTQGNKIDIAT
jgi:hypothetical protein